MELIERDGLLATLQAEFQKIITGEGHCIFLSGEAGMGKTSLVKAFCKEQSGNCKIYLGACDSLFTPRPLAALFDIMWQMNSELWPVSHLIDDRTTLFTNFFREISNQKEIILIIFEDIHWADEATLDFIKFFARRITHLRCLFILTYRENEIHSRHPLRSVMGHIPPDSFERLQLAPLSRTAVHAMALEKGLGGEDVYTITGGNPFYVTEILSSYNQGVPDSIKDSILSVYNRKEAITRQIWELLSVSPTGFELKYVEKFEPLYAAAIENCLELEILYLKNSVLFFKHELFRRTIETSLSPLKRVELNKRILDLFLEDFEEGQEIERIIHHAKNANQNELVVKFAPLAAKKAASVGAHIEASRLYLSAIEYYQGNDQDQLIQFYESYAYECYLTNQIKEAIINTGKSLNLWAAKNDIENTGNCMRFLSRLWWFEGNRDKAETYARQAIETLENQPASRTKALALSNMSQLKVLSYNFDECITWGVKAIAMSKELADEEVLCHALNNVGTAQCIIQVSRQEGIRMLQQSLAIALKNSYHEYAARAYLNLALHSTKMKDYEFAKKTFEEGIQYCKDRDLDLYTILLMVFRARLHLETGNWQEAYDITDNLIKKEDPPAIAKIEALVIASTIKMRRGDRDVLPLLLEAKENAFETKEPRSVIPTVTALLEYEWITGRGFISNEDLNCAMSMLEYRGNIYEKSESSFWLLKTGKQQRTFQDSFEGFPAADPAMVRNAANLWEQLGCPYQQALALFEGDDDDKKEAIKIVHDLGAIAVYEKMKLEMRISGIKSIPRGQRKTTLSNVAQLTLRELDVLYLLKEGLQNREIANRLFISAKTVDHHISSILFKLDANSRTKAVKEAINREIIK